jgi:hypothetical protein
LTDDVLKRGEVAHIREDAGRRALAKLVRELVIFLAHSQVYGADLRKRRSCFPFATT